MRALVITGQLAYFAQGKKISTGAGTKIHVDPCG
jgi:hypothetical protein